MKVLYRKEDKTIIAEVKPTERYHIPTNVSVFNGNLKQFRNENKDYSFTDFNQY